MSKAMISTRLQIWANSIRDGLMLLLPLTLVGAFMTAIACNPFPGYGEWMSAHFGTYWLSAVTTGAQATSGIMGLASAMLIASRLTWQLGGGLKRVNFSAPGTAAVAAAAFLIVVLPASTQSFAALGYASLFEGVIVGLITAELMHLYATRLPLLSRLHALEESDTLLHSLQLSVLGVFTLITIVVIAAVFKSLWHGVTPLLMPSPATLSSLAHLGSAPLNVALVVVNQLLWTVGINGGQVLLQWGAAGARLIAAPQIAHATNMASPMFVNAFAHLGGAGATWGLIVITLIRGKDPALRKLAWASLVPAIINVNEPFLVGIPLVFGRAWLVPFVMAPVINCLIAEACLGAMHAMGMATHVGSVVWSTPIFVSGYVLTGSWMGALIQLLSLIASALIYWPYMERKQVKRKQAFKDALDQAITFLSAPVVHFEPLLTRSDTYGQVARSLIEEFRADLGTDKVYLVYHPIHDINNKVMCVEALLRWQHAEYGAIPPPAVINPAEECDLIHRIGEWVIRQACADMAIWHQAGYTGFKVAVNVSPVQLDSPRWVQVVKEVMQTYGTAPQDLELEITEGRALTSNENSDKSLLDLQRMGVALSMDDFGMGSASLLYMQRFKMHSIKLDACLIRNILTNSVSQDVVRTIARLGRSLGVHVVAEFVETADQREMLINLGCDQFQGWFYTPAMRSNELPAYLHRAVAQKKLAAKTQRLDTHMLLGAAGAMSLVAPVAKTQSWV